MAIDTDEVGRWMNSLSYQRRGQGQYYTKMVDGLPSGMIEDTIGWLAAVEMYELVHTKSSITELTRIPGDDDWAEK